MCITFVSSSAVYILKRTRTGIIIIIITDNKEQEVGYQNIGKTP